MRLLLAATALVIASFSILPAPHPILGWFALVATEWGHLVALGSLLLLAPGWRTNPEGRRIGVLALLAATIALAPVLRAVPVARALPNRLATAFGAAPPTAFCGEPPRSSGLLVADLLVGLRPRAVAEEQLSYGTAGGVTLMMRVLRSDAPDCPTPAPGVIVVHGPTWRFNDTVSFDPLDRYLAARGFTVVTIGYRPPPRSHHPAQTQDIAAAIEYVQDKAAAIGVNRSRLALLGRGMNGQLALHTAYRLRLGSLRGVVALYPTSDLRALHEMGGQPALADSRSSIEEYLGGPPDRISSAYQRASPINGVGPRSPATLVIHGDRDSVVPIEQSLRLDQRLADADRQHLLVRLPWAAHRCDVYLAGPCGQISTFAIERFLAWVLR